MILFFGENLLKNSIIFFSFLFTPFKITPLAIWLLIMIPSPEYDLLKFIFSKLFFNFKIKSSLILKLFGWTTTCGFKPKIFCVKSVLNPFITDITIIRIATPSIIPRNENIEIIFKKPSFFLGFKFLNEISLSALVNNLL